MSASAARTPRAAHDYQACRDDDCPRPACLAYREGHDEGYPEGFADGNASGFAAGQAAAAASCSCG